VSSIQLPKGLPSSQCVPLDVLNITTFFLSHMFWLELDIHICKLKRWAKGKHLCSSILGVPNVPILELNVKFNNKNI
jgi:hypothetical protein